MWRRWLQHQGRKWSLCKKISEQRCSGSNAIVIQTVWSECAQCQATGYYRNKECPSCTGVGYLFVFLGDKTTV
jgi:hypothetical protein